VDAAAADAAARIPVLNTALLVNQNVSFSSHLMLYSVRWDDLPAKRWI